MNVETMSRDELITAWLNSKATAAAAVETERNLRAALVKNFFEENKPDTGTVNKELGNGYKLKFVFKQNLKLDKEKVLTQLQELERQGDEGKFIAERLVKFNPELSLTEYKNLDPKHKKIIDKAITTSEASPTIEFIEPKAKG